MPGASSGPTDGPLTFEELRLAARNRGMPLEALHYDITPSGLHYLLVHFDIPVLDEHSHRLAIDGAVDTPIDLSMEQLRARPAQTLAVTLECAGNGRAHLHPRPLSQPWLDEAIGTARWTGTPLGPLLRRAGLRGDVVELVFTGADQGTQGGEFHRYARSLSVADAMRDEVMLAYAMNDRPLEPQHGFPVRLIVPGWYGMTSVKWLTSITAVTEPFDGYQQRATYLYKQSDDDPGTPVDKIRPRALLIPPGTPDFFTRARTLPAGEVVLRGRAWAGGVPIERVEVGIDGVFADATMAPAVGPFAWRGFSLPWNAVPGDHELSCRATDQSGRVQPDQAPWNVQGMGQNGAQRIRVAVR